MRLAPRNPLFRKENAQQRENHKKRGSLRQRIPGAPRRPAAFKEMKRIARSSVDQALHAAAQTGQLCSAESAAAAAKKSNLIKFRKNEMNFEFTPLPPLASEGSGNTRWLKFRVETQARGVVPC